MARMNPIWLFGALAAGFLWTTPAAANPETIETARLLALLLDSGRIVVGANQALINDKDMANKGFTPDVFEQQLVAMFKERSGVDMATLTSAKIPERARTLLPELLETAKQTVATAQPIINKRGIGFKNFAPANFGTQVAARFSAKTGVYLKQTTVDPLLRNPRNKADDFESTVLKQFADPAFPRSAERAVTNILDGGKTVRLMMPLYYGEGCLACHGEPRGEQDVTAYRKEGMKLGDLGGAISVKLAVR